MQLPEQATLYVSIKSVSTDNYTTPSFQAHLKPKSYLGHLGKKPFFFFLFGVCLFYYKEADLKPLLKVRLPGQDTVCGQQ